VLRHWPYSAWKPRTLDDFEKLGATICSWCQQFVRRVRKPFRSDVRAMDRNKYDEIWVETDDGQVMCALINDQLGWLMYLREPGDAGFSSRNPNYTGPESATLDYYLSNGQRDLYPLAWALPIDEVQRAIDFFKRERKPPPFVTWHNDSEDGTVIGPEG
jgi:hypothetical protein